MSYASKKDVLDFIAARDNGSAESRRLNIEIDMLEIAMCLIQDRATVPDAYRSLQRAAGERKKKLFKLANARQMPPPDGPGDSE